MTDELGPDRGGFPEGIAGEVTGSGPLLCWGHGLTSSRASEDALGLHRFTEIGGHTIARYDAPGHGGSAAVGDDETTTWPRLGELMLAVAAGLGAPRFVAAGASMGAASALWAAVTDPGAIEALVLVIPPTAWETRAAQGEIYLAGAAHVETGGISAYLDEAEARPLNPSIGELALAQRKVTRAALEHADPVSFAHVLRGAAGSNLPPREAVARLQMPAAIFSWEGDPQHPVSTGEELESLMGDAVLHTASDLAGVRAWRDLAGAFLAGLH